MNPPPPLAPPPPVPEKKGLSGLAWAGIGCGTLVVILIALAIGGGFFVYKKASKAIREFSANPEKLAAEMLIRTSGGELQKVSSDEAKGEITVRTKAGEVFTVPYKDITDGKFTFEDSKGVETRLGLGQDLSQVPAWVPKAPEVADTLMAVNSVTDGKAGGVYSVTSTSAASALDDYFKEEASRLGLTSSSGGSTNFNSKQAINRTYSDATREFTVSITSEGGKAATVYVTYQEK